MPPRRTAAREVERKSIGPECNQCFARACGCDWLMRRSTVVQGAFDGAPENRQELARFVRSLGRISGTGGSRAALPFAQRGDRRHDPLAGNIAQDGTAGD